MNPLFLRIFIILSFLSLSMQVFANDESIPLDLKLPDGFFQSTCPSPAWTNAKVLYKGVKDLRAADALGTIKKGDRDIVVTPSPALALQFDEALRELFPYCGLTLLSSDPTGKLPVLSVEIKEFSSGGEKKMFTENNRAQSRVSVSLDRKEGTSSWMEARFEMEAKGMRKKNIRFLEKTLNELFSETLKQIPTSPQLRSF